MDRHEPAHKPRRRFVGKAQAGAGATGRPPVASTSRALQQQQQLEPTEPLLEAAIAALLPSNYKFEVPKTVAQIKRHGASRVALQLPEGLQMFACALADLLERFAQVECVVLADVTYGACCVDDFTATALGCDMLVHYGHSCLVPVDTTTIKTLYVFVEIQVDVAHLVRAVADNFPRCIGEHPQASPPPSRATGKGAPTLSIEPEQPPSATSPSTNDDANADNTQARTQTVKLALVSTIQFVAAIHALKADLDELKAQRDGTLAPPTRLAISDGRPLRSEQGAQPRIDQSDSEATAENEQQTRVVFETYIPQVKPLSPGEILGCTAPRLSPDTDAVLYVGDGRFHLESVMVANPMIPAFRYDPYAKRLSSEAYDHDEMRKTRRNALETAKDSLAVAAAASQDGQPSAWAVVLGTLGRQGNLRVLKVRTSSLRVSASPDADVNELLLAQSVTRHLPNGKGKQAAKRPPFMPILLSELSPAKLALFRDVSTFVQTSCPRLSIDWGDAFGGKPLLTPYEANVALGAPGARPWRTSAGASSKDQDNDDYPMDFYADKSMGEWTPRHGMDVRRRAGANEAGRPVPRRLREQQSQTAT